MPTMKQFGVEFTRVVRAKNGDSIITTITIPMLMDKDTPRLMIAKAALNSLGSARIWKFKKVIALDSVQNILDS